MVTLHGFEKEMRTMARISMVQSNEGPFNFYNVDAAVGPGAPNGRTDVLLVQYFLREVFKSVPPGRLGGGGRPSRSAG
jgi:hypothetical protein